MGPSRAGRTEHADERRRSRIVEALARGGSVFPDGEADVLLRAAREGAGSIDRLVDRRLAGEPIAWIVGWTRFRGVRVRIDRGVFVPRPRSEELAGRGVAALPADGIALDLCTGSGAVAAVLASARPGARVIGTDVDPLAVACARRNGVHALEGDLFGPVPRSLRGRVDVIAAVVPYVPTDELDLLPRDVLAFEPARAIDGGPRGSRVLVRVARAAAGWLRPGGTVFLEIGGDQADEVAAALIDGGCSQVRVHRDDDGRDRSIEAGVAIVTA